VDDYSVGVTYSEELKRKTPQEAVKAMPNADDYIRMLRSVFSDGRLIESGSTNLSSQPAKFYVTEMTVKSFGVDVPYKQLQVQTARNGNVYTLTCRTAPERFEKMLPVFKLIMAGFVIKPDM
jgi:hypothetical protein